MKVVQLSRKTNESASSKLPLTDTDSTGALSVHFSVEKNNSVGFLGGCCYTEPPPDLNVKALKPDAVEVARRAANNASPHHTTHRQLKKFDAILRLQFRNTAEAEAGDCEIKIDTNTGLNSTQRSSTRGSIDSKRSSNLLNASYTAQGNSWSRDNSKSTYMSDAGSMSGAFSTTGMDHTTGTPTTRLSSASALAAHYSSQKIAPQQLDSARSPLMDPSLTAVGDMSARLTLPKISLSQMDSSGEEIGTCRNLWRSESEDSARQGSRFAFFDPSMDSHREPTENTTNTVTNMDMSQLSSLLAGAPNSSKGNLNTTVTTTETASEAPGNSLQQSTNNKLFKLNGVGGGAHLPGGGGAGRPYNIARDITGGGGRSGTGSKLAGWATSVANIHKVKLNSGKSSAYLQASRQKNHFHRRPRLEGNGSSQQLASSNEGSPVDGRRLIGGKILVTGEGRLAGPGASAIHSLTKSSGLDIPSDGYGNCSPHGNSSPRSETPICETSTSHSQVPENIEDSTNRMLVEVNSALNRSQTVEVTEAGMSGTMRRTSSVRSYRRLSSGANRSVDGGASGRVVVDRYDGLLSSLSITPPRRPQKGDGNERESPATRSHSSNNEIGQKHRRLLQGNQPPQFDPLPRPNRPTSSADSASQQKSVASSPEKAVTTTSSKKDTHLDTFAPLPPVSSQQFSTGQPSSQIVDIRPINELHTVPETELMLDSKLTNLPQMKSQLTVPDKDGFDGNANPRVMLSSASGGKTELTLSGKPADGVPAPQHPLQNGEQTSGARASHLQRDEERDLVEMGVDQVRIKFRTGVEVKAVVREASRGGKLPLRMRRFKFTSGLEQGEMSIERMGKKKSFEFSDCKTVDFRTGNVDAYISPMFQRNDEFRCLWEQQGVTVVVAFVDRSFPLILNFRNRKEATQFFLLVSDKDFKKFYDFEVISDRA